MSASDVIAIVAILASSSVSILLHSFAATLTYRIESYVFTAKLFGENKYGSDAITQIVHLRNRSDKTLTDIVLKSKCVGKVIDSDVEENGYIGKSDVSLMDDPDHAEWHMKINLMPPRARVAVAVLTNGLMRSHHLTGGARSVVLMHDLEYKFRWRRRGLLTFLATVAAFGIWMGIKWLTNSTS